MIRKHLVDLTTTLLVILLAYTALSKILEADTFRKQMLNQPLPETLKQNLVWLVPVSEIITSIFLIIKPIRLYGFVLAFLLMLAFTLYVSMILGNAFAYIPCSCGGVLSAMSWQTHLIFNIFFTLIAFTGFLIERKRRLMMT
jgi:putative oxidoreductase